MLSIVRRRLIDSKTVGSDYNGWLEFDVSLILSNWNSNRRKVIFEIESEDPYGNYHNVTSFIRGVNCNATNEGTLSANSGNAPYLQLHTVEST